MAPGPIERYAVFNAHGSTRGTKCWLCDEPLNFVEMEVDHVLPEKLLDDKGALTEALRQFGLPPDFDLNSLENWLPAHARCNNQKRDHIFRPTPLIQYWIDRAAQKAAKAREFLATSATQRQIERAIGVLATGDTAPPRALLDPIIQHYASANSEPTVVGQKIVVPSSGDLIGFGQSVPVYGYVPPAEVRLGPKLTITFDADQRPEANGPFKYTVITSEEK
jgi:hypothetical protein